MIKQLIHFAKVLTASSLILFYPAVFHMIDVFFSLFETGNRSLIHAFIESEKITALGKMIKTFINRLK